jgi:hypothetical protein
MVQRLSGTGYIHSALGTLDTMLRNLFQTYGTSGEIIMSDGLLFIIAIVVFSLMAIGLILTIYEFREHIIEDPNKKDQTFHGEKVEPRLKRQ